MRPWRPNTSPPMPTPQDDITLIQYELSRTAFVSIYLEDSAGTRYYFRQERLRGAGTYEVYFSGVVDGYTLPDEVVQSDSPAVA